MCEKRKWFRYPMKVDSNNLKMGSRYLAKCSFLEDLKKIYTISMKILLAIEQNLANFWITGG